MTNTTLLKAKIDASGYKMKYVADRIGLTYQGFLNKIRNKTDFTAPEIKGLCELLHIETEEMEQIFFCSVSRLFAYFEQEDQMNANIHINVDEIPPEVAERIGCVFLGYHKWFQQNPELMAELEVRRAARKKLKGSVQNDENSDDRVRPHR